MFAVLHQQKALLALAEEQMRVVELQQEIVKAEQARGELCLPPPSIPQKALLSKRIDQLTTIYSHAGS